MKVPAVPGSVPSPANNMKLHDDADTANMRLTTQTEKHDLPLLQAVSVVFTFTVLNDYLESIYSVRVQIDAASIPRQPARHLMR